MLTKELILSKYPNNIDITSIKKLNMCSNNISNISILSQMKDLEIISLSSNKISFLYPISKCENLRELNLRNNYIFSFDELFFLQNLKKLKILGLEDNPISYDDNYLEKVLTILPNLHYLDNKNVIDLINIKNRNVQYKYMKRVLTEEKAMLEINENKNILNISNYNSKNNKKKLSINRVFSYFDAMNNDKENSSNISRNKNSYAHYLKFINKEKGKSERKKEINFKDIKLKFKNNKRTLCNKILVNNCLNAYPKNVYFRKQTVDIDLKNNLNKNKGIKDTHTAQNSIVNQNTSEFKKSITINTKILFKGKNIFNNKFKGNAKNLKFYKNNETKTDVNNSVMAASLLVNKINMEDLILLRKFINKKIEILTK